MFFYRSILTMIMLVGLVPTYFNLNPYLTPTNGASANWFSTYAFCLITCVMLLISNYIKYKKNWKDYLVASSILIVFVVRSYTTLCGFFSTMKFIDFNHNISEFVYILPITSIFTLYILEPTMQAFYKLFIDKNK